MSTLAFGTTAGMLDSFSILERIIAIETKRWINIQFFAGSLNRKPDMFKVTEHLFFHYTCFLRYFSDNHRPLLEKFNYLLTNCLHIGKTVSMMFSAWEFGQDILLCFLFVLCALRGLCGRNRLQVLKRAPSKEIRLISMYKKCNIYKFILTWPSKKPAILKIF